MLNVQKATVKDRRPNPPNLEMTQQLLTPNDDTNCTLDADNDLPRDLR